MAYSSDLNIRIGQMPEIKDNPQVFNELQQVYNALHLLNSAVSSLRGRGGECRPDNADDWEPWETFNFECKSFWAPASNSVKQGNLVRFGSSQFIPGISGKMTTTHTGTKLNCAGSGSSGRAWYEDQVEITVDMFGFCIEDTVDGYAHIAWPPFIVELSGLSFGDEAFGTTSDGRIYSNSPTANYYPVGRIVAPNALMLMHGLSRRGTRRRHVSWWSSDCHGGGGG
jgi:hypothetical protein